jgi:hypothetical protein
MTSVLDVIQQNTVRTIKVGNIGGISRLVKKGTCATTTEGNSLILQSAIAERNASTMTLMSSDKNWGIDG